MPAFSHKTDELLRGLPGEELIRPGLADLAAGRETVESLLIESAASNLREAGLPVPAIPPGRPEPHLRLYALLCESHGVEAHFQFNTLEDRVDKFCRLLRAERQGRGAGRAPASSHPSHGTSV